VVKGKPLPPVADIQRARMLRACGFKIADVAKELGRSETWVWRWTAAPKPTAGRGMT
jgi:hypothetical protein